MRLLKSHALRAKTPKDPRLVKADEEYQLWLKTQGGIRHPAVLMKARPLQGSIDFNGLPISIETGRSRIREWQDPHNGTSGMTRMNLPYGYIRGTKGTDGDQLDVIVGPDHQAPEVYVVHTNKPSEFTDYDEDKCFLGLNSPEEAMRHFRAAYDNPGFFGSMSIWPFEDFKEAAFTRQGERLDNTRYLPPPESPNGIMEGPGRLFTEQELREWANGDEPLQKSRPDILLTLRDAITAEYDAIKLYTDMAGSIGNDLARKILLAVIDEERVHAGEFLRVLEIIAPDEARLYAEGAKEVQDALGKDAGTTEPAEKD